MIHTNNPISRLQKLHGGRTRYHYSTTMATSKGDNSNKSYNRRALNGAKRLSQGESKGTDTRRGHQGIEEGRGHPRANAVSERLEAWEGAATENNVLDGDEPCQHEAERGKQRTEQGQPTDQERTGL